MFKWIIARTAKGASPLANSLFIEKEDTRRFWWKPVTVKKEKSIIKTELQQSVNVTNRTEKLLVINW